MFVYVCVREKKTGTDIETDKSESAFRRNLLDLHGQIYLNYSNKMKTGEDTYFSIRCL